MYYTVYKITNQINDDYYIGVHYTDDPNDSYMGSGLRIRRSIKKYGRDNFVKDILFSFDDSDTAYAKEKELLKEHLQDKGCLNLSKGGVGGANFAGKKHTEETRAKIRAKRKDYVFTEETKAKISKSLTGRPVSDETKKKLSEAGSKRMQDDETRKRISDSLEAYHKASKEDGTAHAPYVRTPTTIKKLSDARKRLHQENLKVGKRAYNYGKMWVYSNTEKRSMMVSKDTIIPSGWVKGRKLKF